MRFAKLAQHIVLVLLLGVTVLPGPASGAPISVPEAPVSRSILVHAASDADWAEALSAASSVDLTIGTRYPEIGVFVAYGSDRSFDTLSRSSAIARLETNRLLDLATDTSHQATRGSKLLEGKIKVGRPGRKRVIDGTGIGVAVVDTGVDGTHPDLAPRMGGNVRVICTSPGTVIGTVTECKGPKQVVELEDTDTPGAGGHGTHVAGTVAGTGETSDGTYRGAAPGATLYGVGIGTTILVENALDGLRWVLENHDQVTPRIRVVNNSWGGGYSDPQDASVSAVTKMVDLIVKQGVTVVFAAGNRGGTGSAPATSAECVNPTPGVVCVANYDDGGSGTREGSIAPNSSRGSSSDPMTWPDVAAPGTEIMAACRPTLPVCVALGNTQPTDSYGSMSGTSMAAPHVSGIIAQLYQVAPRLTPAQIERILELSAHKFTSPTGGGYVRDPTNRAGTSSFDAGHGLVDAVAAFRQAAAL